ncbi:LON peptidase substrate-binding domain-containing protein [Deinococcus sp. ZS9-10]|uniref:LON peptidase substrate-binding domain-containing protein n=2 Tax=Deinococcus arenicola TaxID=2994950 RepID=A0ABU4DLC9_9DEIO|nr:LON peptidase substrate-binding domain-containing protein [Deinococcus sp. ZS9-10]
MIVPLFPLPNLVLFPGVVLPLYVFEQRYRELLLDVQASGEPFGLVQIVDMSEDASMPFHERVSTVGTLAHLQQAETHEDGTSTIVVVGGERFRVQDFDFDKSYLSASVELWPLEAAPPGQEDVVEASVRRVLGDLLRLRPADAEAIRDGAPEDPVLLASFAANLLPNLSGQQREDALRAPGLLDRLDVLMGAVPRDARLMN